MTPERWRQIEEIFQSCVELDGAEREAFLDHACHGDGQLRHQVTRLLAPASDDPGALEHCLGTTAQDLLSGPQPLKTRIGAYEVVRPIGEGGMGMVYLARRADDAYQQQVAVKVIRPAFALHSAVERFRAERQILAKLAHPNICRLLDGGLTEDGRPYLVMEYLEGEPIDTWCAKRELPLSMRLKLFLDVCAGVHCAHQNLIVHRDIKPSNILVCTDGTPKLLDFGVAKLLEGDTSSVSPPTLMTGQWMTPEYASPEQVLGRPVTTATDVYGLGAVLYELLTGKRPFADRPRTAGALERAICEEDPPRPSITAAAGTTRRTRLPQSLRGDLDNIVLKAMQKEPARRYGTAAELSDDIRRHLQGFPVLARPDSWRYRSSKFVRRNRAAVAVAAAFFITVVGFAIGMAIFAGQAHSQRARAEQVSSFLVGLFLAADPDSRVGHELTARDLLERGVGGLGALRNQPGVQSDLFNTFGLVYQSLGSYDRSRQLLKQSLELKRKVYGRDSLEVADNLKNLAELARTQSDYPEAETMARESIAIRHRKLGRRHALLAEAQNTLALVLHETGRLKEAESVFLEVLGQRDLLDQRQHLETAVLSNLGGLYRDMGDLGKAEQYLTECVAKRRTELGEVHPRLALAIAKLANVQEDAGNLAVAESSQREALAMRQKLFGNQHPDVASSLLQIAQIERKHGQYRDAADDIAKAAEIYRNVGGAGDLLARLRLGQGLLFEAQGALPLAEQAFRSALGERLRRLGANHLNTARAQFALGRILLKEGKLGEARPALEAAAPKLISGLPERDPDRAEAAALLAGLRQSQ